MRSWSHSSRLVDRGRRPGERIRDRWLRLHRRPTDRATDRERRHGAGPGSLRRISGSRRGPRRRGGSRRPLRPRRDRCRRPRLHDGISPRRPPRDLGPARGLHRATTSTGTENALAACREAGVGRFVHCSTEAALIAGRPLHMVDETAPLRPDSKALYCSTKALAERRCMPPPRRGFETVVLRPRFVWGRGDTTLLPSIIAMVEQGKFAWIGGGRHLTRHHPCRQRRRGPARRRGARASGGGLLRHRRRPGRVQRLRLGAARDPGRRTAEPLGPRLARRRGGGRRRGGLEAAAARRRAATDQVRRLGLLAGVHDRHHPRPAPSSPTSLRRAAPRGSPSSAPGAMRPPSSADRRSSASGAVALQPGDEELRVQGGDQLVQGPTPASMISIARSGSTSPASRSVNTRTSSATSGSSASL